MILFFTLPSRTITDFCNRDLRTIIILFSRNVSSHKTDRILTESHVSSSRTTDRTLTESPHDLFCLLYHKGQQFDKYTCMRNTAWNPYTCKQVFYVYEYFVYVGPCRVVVVAHLSIRYIRTALCCYLFISLSPYFFILLLLPRVCLFVNHVKKFIIFVFGHFVYHFKNTTSITTLQSGLLT